MKTIILTIVLIFSLSISAFAAIPTLQLITNPEWTWDGQSVFSEGLMAVSKEIENVKKFAYIDTNGKIAINWFDEAEYFDGKTFGLGISSFHEGIAVIFNSFVIDKTGKTLLDLNALGFVAETDFGDGLIGVADKVYNERTKSFGHFFIDIKGKKLDISPKFEQIGMKNDAVWRPTSAFRNGYAVVCLYALKDEKNVRYAYMDKKGNFIKKNFEAALPFSDERAFVQKGNAFLFINKNGETLSSELERFYHSDFDYSSYKSNYQNLIPAKQNGKWGMLNPDGLFAINPKFENILFSSEDMIAYQQNGKWGYMDKRGKSIINATNNLVGYFKNNYTIVMNNRFSIIDKKGTTLHTSDFYCDNAIFLVDNPDAILYQTDGLWGLAKISYDGMSTKPSSWAKTLPAAREKKLVPAFLDTEYQTVVTREQFATLLVNYAQVYSGKTYNQMTKVKTNCAFTDTQNPLTIVAYQIGIVGGRTETKFDPKKQITREEAATMIANAAKVFGLYKTSQVCTFSDFAAASNWAKDSINFVVQNKVMNGVGGDKFGAKTSCTREQSFITIYNLFNNFQPMKQG